jgi:hypothetical protein
MFVVFLVSAITVFLINCEIKDNFGVLGLPLQAYYQGGASGTNSDFDEI